MAPESEFTAPASTVVHQPIEQMVRDAVSLLLGATDGSPKRNGDVYSTAALRLTPVPGPFICQGQAAALLVSAGAARPRACPPSSAACARHAR